MKYSLILIALFISIIPLTARASDICAVPIVGCGDSNLKIDLEAAKGFLSTGELSSFLNLTTCCSCADTVKSAQSIFDAHRQNFVVTALGLEYFMPAMLNSAITIQKHLMGHFSYFGGFTNASVANDYLRAQQELTTQSRTSNNVSEGLCRAASLSRSLAADDARRKTQQILLSEVGLARILGTDGSSSAQGALSDTQARLRVFTEEFCDITDNAGTGATSGLATLCGTAQSIFTKRANASINFAANFTAKPTINIDLTDKSDTPIKNDPENPTTNLSADEQTLFQLANNLYGHKVIAPRWSANGINNNEEIYLQFRSLFAMRSLVQNSFYAYAAERAHGTGTAAPNMKALVREMSAPGINVDAMIGDKPSYYQQMEMLTKDLYRNTNFYGTLMDGTTNVNRQSAVIQGINLMQTRDIYQSNLRSELLLSTLVELQNRQKLKRLAEGLTGGGS
jgi:hypothetical protein